VQARARRDFVRLCPFPGWHTARFSPADRNGPLGIIPRPGGLFLQAGTNPTPLCLNRAGHPALAAKQSTSKFHWNPLDAPTFFLAPGGVPPAPQPLTHPAIQTLAF
jgi:hypothetical protein